MPSTGSQGTLAFGVFEVEPQSGELRKNGLRVKLGAREARVLLALLESPGQLVTRAELRQRLWSADTFVEFDNGLNNAISRLRSALGDSAESPRFIETVPRQGYRFLAQVAQREVDFTRAFMFPRWVVRLAVLAVALIAVGFALRSAAHRPRRIESLAVLPFVPADPSGTVDQGYLDDAVTGDVRVDLSAVRAVMLIPPKTATEYVFLKKSPNEIARELHVDAIVEGSVRLEEGAVQLNVELVRAASGAVVWTGTFRYHKTDIPRMARQVVRGVVQAANLRLTPQEQKSLASHVDIPAHQQRSEGIDYRSQLTSAP